MQDIGTLFDDFLEQNNWIVDGETAIKIMAFAHMCGQEVRTMCAELAYQHQCTQSWGQCNCSQQIARSIDAQKIL